MSLTPDEAARCRDAAARAVIPVLRLPTHLRAATLEMMIALVVDAGGGLLTEDGVRAIGARVVATCAEPEGGI